MGAETTLKASNCAWEDKGSAQRRGRGVFENWLPSEFSSQAAYSHSPWRYLDLYQNNSTGIAPKRPPSRRSLRGRFDRQSARIFTPGGFKPPSKAALGHKRSSASDRYQATNLAARYRFQKL